MNAQLKFCDLEMVVALQEEGTFTQAARRIGVTQTALSKRLQIVERDIQVRLFERTHDGAVATGSGRTFVSDATQILHTLQRAIYDAREARYGEYRKLRIGVSLYLPSHLIEMIHAVELPLYKHLAVEIVSGSSPEMISDVQSKNVDVALVSSPTPNAALTKQCIARDHFMIIFRQGHPLVAKRSVTLGDIVEYPCLFGKLA